MGCRQGLIKGSLFRLYSGIKTKIRYGHAGKASDRREKIIDKMRFYSYDT
jgi:hypothetical protein